jgi:hypothetical protein
LLKKNISDCWYGGLNNCVKDKDLTLQRSGDLQYRKRICGCVGTEYGYPISFSISAGKVEER